MVVIYINPKLSVVCSLDEWSGSHEFLTALLLDPLSSNEDVTRVLDERWTHSSHDQLHITYVRQSRLVQQLSSFTSLAFLQIWTRITGKCGIPHSSLDFLNTIPCTHRNLRVSAHLLTKRGTSFDLSNSGTPFNF